MINDLFINMLLLMSFTFVAGHILKDVPEQKLNTLYGEVLLGIFGGVLGVLLIVYSIEVQGTTSLFDLRALSIMIISSLGGITSTIVSGIIIGLYRISLYGINQSSITAIFNILIYIVSFHLVDKKVNKKLNKWFTKLLISLIIITSTTYYLLMNIEGVGNITLLLTFVTAFVGAIEYILLDYVRNSNELYRRYKKDSKKDFLTGLDNTRQFDNLLNAAFKRIEETNEKLACLMIDIDFFKKVNDTYGHSIGDVVLKELALIIKNNCRIIDTVGRVGGEEFCALLFDCSIDETSEIAKRINEAVKIHKFPIGKDKFINITISVGVAVYPITTSNLNDIKKEADMALYDAKHSGRDKVCFNKNYNLDKL